MKVGTDGVLLGAWAFQGSDAGEPWRILDVGCGTGVIALMMAQRFPAASITGIEIDADAAEESAMNFAASPWGSRLDAVCADFVEYAINECTRLERDADGFDMIVSNPPFFTNGALAPDFSRRTARHEGALDLSSLISHSARLLKPGGRIGIVLPTEQCSRLEFLAAMAGLDVACECMVKTVEHKAPRRVLYELTNLKPSTGRPMEDSLTLQSEGGVPGDEYRKLVEPFYIRI